MQCKCNSPFQPHKLIGWMTFYFLGTITLEKLLKSSNNEVKNTKVLSEHNKFSTGKLSLTTFAIKKQ